MKKCKYFLTIALIMIVLAVPGGRVLAESIPAQVTDAAKLFTPSEVEDITGQVNELEKSVKWDVMVVTTEDADGMSATEYAEEWFDKNTTMDNGVICLIDMDNRELVIRTFGQAIYYLTDDRVDKILDEAFDKVSEGDYHAACTVMLKGVKEAYQRGIPDDQYTYDENTGEIIDYYTGPMQLTIGEIVFAVLAALAAGGIVMVVVTATYRTKWHSYQYSYRENSRVELEKQEDSFVNQVVTHRRIPKQDVSSSNKSSGGGSRSTTHVGAGGRRSGGGSRKF